MQPHENSPLSPSTFWEPSFNSSGEDMNKMDPIDSTRPSLPQPLIRNPPTYLPTPTSNIVNLYSLPPQLSNSPLSVTPPRSYSIASCSSAATIPLGTPDETAFIEFPYPSEYFGYSIPPTRLNLQRLQPTSAPPQASSQLSSFNPLPFNPSATSHAINDTLAKTMPFSDFMPQHSSQLHQDRPGSAPSGSGTSPNHLGLENVPASNTLAQGYGSGPDAESSTLGLPFDVLPIDPSLNTPVHVNVSGWNPPVAFNPQGAVPAAHIDPHDIQPDIAPPNASSASTVSGTPPLGTEEVQPEVTPDEPWYCGVSDWLNQVETHQRAKIARYNADPLAWKPSETIPRVLMPITEVCKVDHEYLLNIREARPVNDKGQAIATLMRKSEEDLLSQSAKKSKAAAAGKPRRPMNSAFCYMFWRRAQWGQMFPSMNTGQISGWLAAEWSTIKVLKPEEYMWWKDLYNTYSAAFKDRYGNYKYTRAPNGEGRGGKAKARKRAREGGYPYPAAAERNEKKRNGGRQTNDQMFELHQQQVPLHINYGQTSYLPPSVLNSTASSFDGQLPDLSQSHAGFSQEHWGPTSSKPSPYRNNMNLDQAYNYQTGYAMQSTLSNPGASYAPTPTDYNSECAQRLAQQATLYSGYPLGPAPAAPLVAAQQQHGGLQLAHGLQQQHHYQHQPQNIPRVMRQQSQSIMNQTQQFFDFAEFPPSSSTASNGQC